MDVYPEQLPEESDKAYGHFCAWIDFPGRDRPDATAAFAAARGIRPDYVRRLRSKYEWPTRSADRPSVETAIRQRTNDLTIEKTAESVADKVAAARASNTVIAVSLAGKVGRKALEAVDRIDVNHFDENLGRFVTTVLRALVQAETVGAGPVSSVQVNTTTTTTTTTEVNVEVDSLRELPPAQAAERATEITAEAHRKAQLLATYYAESTPS